MSKRSRLLTLTLLAAVAAMVACNMPFIARTPTPTPSPTPTPVPIAPQVIQVMPAEGEEQPLDAPLQLVFDQPMDAQTVEAAFEIEPSVGGTFEWASPRVVRFEPADDGFQRATRYELRVDDEAESAQNLGLREPFRYRFSTVGFLEVTETQPADGAEEIATDATVTVVFNRPVVPLTGIEEQQELPQPLTFDPPVEGSGEWINTSIYAFTPEERFQPSTTYEATISAGLTDTTGGVVEQDVTWQFTTVMPAVVATHPGHNTIYVSPEPTVHVAFNQPMAHGATEAAFSLVNTATGELAPGRFEWHGEGLVLPNQETYQPYQWSWDRGEGPERVGVETMSFTPDEPLDFGTTYRLEVTTDAQAAGGAPLSTPYSSDFRTISSPQILSSEPSNGAEQVSPDVRLQVQFTSPMDPESFSGQIAITPSISATAVYSYWWDSDTQLELSFPVEPNGSYEVTFGDEVQGRYGQPLEGEQTIRWSTRGYDPLVYLPGPGKVGAYSAYTSTAAYVTVRNVGQVSFQLYHMPLDDFLQANDRDSWEYWENYNGNPDNLVRQWTEDVTPPLNERRFFGTSLTDNGSPLAPGLYFFKVSAVPGSIYPEAGPTQPQASKQMLVVSRHNLSLKTARTESLVWATDLRSGEPLADLPITVTDDTGDRLAEGQTDQSGTFASSDQAPRSRWEPIFAFAGNPEAPGEDFSAAVSTWDDDITPWRFDMRMESYDTAYSIYVFTDRPIYRPEQTVYFKGMLRREDDARYSLPGSDLKMHVAINDPDGKVVFEDTFDVSEMGTIDGAFELAEEAALGNYSISVTHTENKDDSFNTSFQVAEYRKPEFQVAVETDRDEYAQGDTINVTAQAEYYFGGPVAEAEIQYTVLSADYFFDYQGPGRWDFVDYDYARDYSGYYGERIAEGEGTTDANGRFTFQVDADIAEEIASQRFTLEVIVTDISDQEVANRTEAIVHKGAYYIGLRPERYVGTAGEENEVNLITVDWESEPVADREITVVFAEHEWYSVRKEAEDGRFYWESVVEDTPIVTETVETDDEGRATVSFTPETGGIYKVIATGLDEQENEVRSSTYMWISGSDYVSWRRDNNDRIDLVADQERYQVGDTATILIPHPYQGPVQALITLERGHIYEHRVETLETNSEQIEIPITEDLIPNVYVSVMIVQGSDDAELDLASFKMGYAELPIETTEKELEIAITPDRAADEHYTPGSEVTYDLLVTDSDGDPVKAELTLSLVDLAVLSLADRPGPGLVDHFWRERGLGVKTATGLTISGDRVSQQIAEEVKGMGGGGGGQEFGAVREEFPDLAYWNAALQTDTEGRASVSVELPDNLTTWRLSAYAVTEETLVGEATHDIISTKDLLVRPVAPRFFVVGDEAELAMVVHNNTEATLGGEAGLQAMGLQIGSDATVPLEVPANDKVRLAWPVTVDDGEEVTLRFGARAGDFADAVEITLPVYRYSAPEVIATAGVLERDGQRLEAVALPPNYDPTQGELSVHVDPSLAAGMADGLDYLTHFPYECTEQVVSRFLPNVVTYRVFQELGIERPELEETLPGLVSEGLQRLYARQHYDGGWSWWTEGESDPFLSAYVALGMVEAERADFTVDESAVEQAIQFLQNSLVSARDVEESAKANQQAFVLYVLAEADEAETARTVALFRQRELLDTFGKAYLAMALGLMDEENDSRIDTLLSDITSEAIISATGAHWEEAQPDYYAMNTDTRSTAIVLAALARLDPDHGLGPNAVRWLMAVRENGTWETTQENVWAILGLTDWMVSTGELEGAYNWHVAVNDELLGEGSVDEENVDQTMQLQIDVADLLAEAVNRVVIERWAPQGQGSGTGQLYYSMYLRLFRPVEDVTALNRGIIVNRRYTDADCEPAEERCPAIDRATVGDRVRVNLTLIAPHDLHYVVVEDPYPAGAEGVDTRLETTSVLETAPRLIRTDRDNPWGWAYGWWWFSHTEMRDEKMVLFADYLPRGTYEYTYVIRAGLPGEFRTIPTQASEMYFPEVFGRSEGGLFTITRE